MKRVLLTVLTLLAAWSARADERSAKTLAAMNAAIKALGTYELTFTVSAADEFNPMDGRCIVSGNSYNIWLPTGSLFGDDKSACKVDPSMMTVTLMKPDPRNHNLLSNPAKAFELLDGSFTHKYIGQAKINGKDCDQIELTPSDKTLPISKMTLYIALRGSLPVAVRYTIDGLSSPVAIDIKTMKSLPQVDRSKFTFDKKRYNGYEIIDLR